MSTDAPLLQLPNDRVYIQTDKGYWRAGACGYTNDTAQAGVWERASAEVIIANLGPEKEARLVPVKDGLRDDYFAMMRAHMDEGGQLSHLNGCDLMREVERLRSVEAALRQRNDVLEREVLAADVIVRLPDGKQIVVTKLIAEELRRLSYVIERDRGDIAKVLIAVRKVIAQHEWLRLGRGSYEADDDRWKDEFGEAMDRIEEALEPAKTMARDWTDCPTLRNEIVEARKMPRLSHIASVLEAAMQKIAKQKTLSELASAGEDLEGDFETAYDTIVEEARAAILTTGT